MKEIQIKCQGAGTLPLENLTQFQGNLKTITQANLKKLRSRILDTGFVAPIFIWKKDKINYILDGHQRILALQSLQGKGYHIPDLPVAYIEADNEEDARKKLLSITSTYGDFNLEELQGWLVKVDEDIADSLRFFDKELNFGLDGKKETVDDDNVPAEVEPISKLGDLWELGKHRVLCGDSTDKETVEKLMDGKKADMVFTDPPYGIEFEDEKGNKIKNDNLNDEELKKFNIDWQKIAYNNAQKDCFMLAWQSPRKFILMDFSGEWDFFRLITMYKSNRISFPHGAWINKTEACMIYTKGKPKITKKNYLDDCYVYTHDKESHEDSNVGHPTPKPVKMIIEHIRAVTGTNQIILDLFGGSGSTMIACERETRINYSMELDAHYCDVIVNRYKTWCEANGKIPEIKLNGEVFHGQT